MKKSSLRAYGFILPVLFVGGAILGTAPCPALAQSVDIAAHRQELEQNLADIEKQIDTQRSILDAKQKESVSLARDVAILNAKIEKAKLSIRALNLAISRLSQDIAGKAQVIGTLNNKLDRERESLGQIIRKTNEIDSFSLPEAVLANSNLSQFFQDLDSFRAIKTSLRSSFTLIEDTRNQTEGEKQSLEDKKQEQVALKTLQELEQRRTEQDQQEKANILKVSRGIESVYQTMISVKEKDAAKIRAELFTLRGSAAIPFEKALFYATAAGNRTGVRPALILGIVAEESNLGENVGTGNWRVDMKAPRDTGPFILITSKLGLNPDAVPVSKKPWYGYGGAMGPAQFIPSTWILYEARIAKATGHNPPNPWDPYDAFMAAAILLMDNGADKGTAAAERLASLRYLAGRANATKKAYAFYGDDVMDLAAKYQKQINILQRN